MGFFKLGGMTLGSLFKKPETLKYPYETKEPYEGQKGHVAHIDPETCNLCSICAKRCPATAIEVSRPKKTWAINHLQCVQCGYCISSCPKKCLEMKGEKPSIATEIEMEVVEIPMPDKKPAAKKPADKKPAAGAKGKAKDAEKDAKKEQAKKPAPKKPAEKPNKPAEDKEKENKPK